MALNDLDFGFGFNDINFSDRVLRLDIVHDDIDEGDCYIEVKTIHISSIVLAAKSPFFLKLFSNGMKESEEGHATLKVHSSEEVALMDLLKFMYTNKLSSSTTSSFLDVLMVADKFQVSSCMTYCTQLLSNLPMTCEFALQFFHLPSSVFMADEVQCLVDAAQKYLVRYKDFTKGELVIRELEKPTEVAAAKDIFKQRQFEEELLKLPIAGIEVVLSSDYLNVASEDIVYDLVLKWARKHYPLIEKRREILTTRLGSLIRFDYMTYTKLKEISSCDDFDPAYASKVVVEALFFKAQSSHLQIIPRFVERVYTFRPVKVLESKLPYPHCVVHLDLKKEVFDNLLPSHRVYSEEFHVGGKRLYLVVERCTKDLTSDSLGLFLGMWGKERDPCYVVYQFSARSKPTKDFFYPKPKAAYAITAITAITVEGPKHGYDNLFGISWSQFIAKDSVYFINGVVYFKVEIKMQPW